MSETENQFSLTREASNRRGGKKAISYQLLDLPGLVINHQAVFRPDGPRG
jgi:hypothetical protein